MIEKELPIKVIFSKHLHLPRKMEQHIKRVRIYGPGDDCPEELVLNADEIAEGGELTVDDLSLPDGFEITDRGDSDPVITVEYPKKEKRGKREAYDD